jgi:hypothetical protein
MNQIKIYPSIKKGDLISITFLNISNDINLKQKTIIGTCLQLKKNKQMPTITLTITILNEKLLITFLLKSPLILKIKKLK